MYDPRKPASLSSIIQQLQSQLPSVNSENNIGTFTIDIRRDFVLRDALREGQKAKFDNRKHLHVSYMSYSIFCLIFNYFIWYSQVCFVGEGAIDAGGPRREFFRLLAHQASDSSYFHGGFLVCNTAGYKVRLFSLHAPKSLVYICMLYTQSYTSNCCILL